MVSLICPIYNEEKHIERCITSIMAQDYPHDDMEMVFIDGMSSDGTRDIVRQYASRNPHIRLLDNPKHTVPYALNIGIRSTTGDIVMRIDAHCAYPTNYVSRLVAELKRLNADNVGGVWNTLPAKDTTECVAIAIGSSHPFGVGASVHKIGVGNIKRVDTVPFGCYHRKVFDRIGLFDEELTRNQDDEFNARLINHGGSIYIIPDVVIDYTARDSMPKMRKMYFQYGLFKPLVNKKLGSPASMRQFFPSLFVLGIVFGGILSFFLPCICAAYLATLFFYLGVGVGIGSKRCGQWHKPSLWWYMPYTFLNIHLSYGIGYLCGIYKVAAHKDFNVKSNR